MKSCQLRNIIETLDIEAKREKLNAMVELNNIYITYLIKYQSESQLYAHSAEIMLWCPPSTRTS